MKSPLILIAFLVIGMLAIQPASGLSPAASSCCANDSTGTGGEIPGMGWGDNGGNTGATIPGMGWGASECRDNDWDDYENK